MTRKACGAYDTFTDTSIQMNCMSIKAILSFTDVLYVHSELLQIICGCGVCGFESALIGIAVNSCCPKRPVMKL